MISTLDDFIRSIAIPAGKYRGIGVNPGRGLEESRPKSNDWDKSSWKIWIN